MTSKPSRETWDMHKPFFSMFSYQVIVYGIYATRLVSYLPEWSSNLLMTLLSLVYKLLRWLNKWVS